MDEINRRNTVTVELTLKNMSAQILSQQIRIDGLNNVMSTMSERINQLEHIILLQKVQSTGTGASVK